MPKLTIRAERIVSLPDYDGLGGRTLVCYQFNTVDVIHLRQHLDESFVTIELVDSNGTFVSSKPQTILSVEMPNEDNWACPNDVLLVRTRTS